MDYQDYIQNYRNFVASSLTERMCSREIISRLQASGFIPLEEVKQLSPGDRVYRNVKDRTVLAAVAGKNPGNLRIVGSHVDSPKLDLKPVPFFEDGRLALMELHDYGWIKPYQWVNTPLALCGIVYTADSRQISFCLGCREDEPVFAIPDLPPHLSGKQMKKTAEEAFTAEQMNALCANAGKEGESAVDKVLSLLKNNYGVDAEDFTCADLCLVPAAPLRDVGFDGALLGGYGQDDRACVFASLQGLLETTSPTSTAVGFFVDKEEVASTGDTSAQSNALRNFIAMYTRKLGSDYSPYDTEFLLEKAQCISADVTGGFDPNFADLYDRRNIAYMGGGIAVQKYGAAGSGKFRASEASAEFMQTVRSILNAHDISWQTGTISKLGEGGGGTIAQFISRMGMDCVDAGPPLLAMHTSFELSAKSDLYASYSFYKAFMNS